MHALPIDDLPTLRYFLWGRNARPSAWSRVTGDVRRLFATLEEAQAAADEMAVLGYYSDFAIYVIERGRLRRITSADALGKPGRASLVWMAEPNLSKSG